MYSQRRRLPWRLSGMGGEGLHRRVRACERGPFAL